MQGGLQRVPPNLALAAVLLRLLADAGAPHDSLAKLLLAWRAGMPPDDWQQVLLRAASVFDTALLDAWLDLASALKHPGAEMWPVIRYFYREPQQALVHAQQARARFPGNPDLLMSLACAAILQQDHPLAESLCQEGLAASTLPAQRESFQFKLFELKCFAGDADQARSMLSEFSVEELSAVQKLATARFLAQQRDWARVADIMAGLLPELKTLEDSHLDLVLRAARATGTHDRFLAGLPEGIGAAACTKTACWPNTRPPRPACPPPARPCWTSSATCSRPGPAPPRARAARCTTAPMPPTCGPPWSACTPC